MPPAHPVTFFDDDGHALLSPLNDLRETADIRTGALTTRERFEAVLGVKVVPSGGAPSGPALFVNSRCPLPALVARSLAPGEAIVEDRTGDIVAMVTTDPRQALEAKDRLTVVERVKTPCLLSRPWHARTFRDACLDSDLALLVTRVPRASAIDGVVTFGAHPLAVHASAKVYPGVIIDRETGPVVIDENAVIRPGAQLVGPVYVGKNSTILDKALIKPHTAIGPWCKVAGEVGGTIFQGFANKAHDGHLGDSWIGEWANLGAGTTNSNLLNTYGEVVQRAAPSAGLENTGEVFLGAIIGDHVKTAICTRIMTGAILHTGTMYAATAPASGCIPRFSWVTDAGSRGFRFDKFLDVACLAMARRKVTPSDAMIERMRRLHGTPH